MFLHFFHRIKAHGLKLVAQSGDVLLKLTNFVIGVTHGILHRIFFFDAQPLHLVAQRLGCAYQLFDLAGRVGHRFLDPRFGGGAVRF